MSVNGVDRNDEEDPANEFEDFLAAEVFQRAPVVKWFCGLSFSSSSTCSY